MIYHVSQLAITNIFCSQILLIQHKLPQLRAIIQYTGVPPLSDQRRLHKSHGKHILSWEEMMELGKVTILHTMIF